MNQTTFLSNKRQDLHALVLFSLLFSFTLLFAFTPLGAISFGVVTILIAHLPMILGFFVLPERYSYSLAFLFGVCRLIRNTYDIQPLSSFWFSPFAPVIQSDKGSLWALVINFLPLLAIVVFSKLLNLRAFQWWKIILFSVGATLLNTSIVLLGVYLAFKEPLEQALSQHLAPILLGIAFSNGLLEALMAALIIPVIVKAVQSSLKKFR